MPDTQTYSITLPIEMAREIERKVRSGDYPSVTDVIRDGVRAMLDHDASIESWLRHEVARRYDDQAADPSQAVPADQVMGRLRQQAASRRDTSSEA